MGIGAGCAPEVVNLTRSRHNPRNLIFLIFIVELSSEDNLKLNVLLANSQAIRINEHRMQVTGMTTGGDAQITLNPTCSGPRYIKLVKEMIASHVLGSPQGYPVFLKRWTRMGDMQTTRLEPLLMLGEEEAVIAVARAPRLTDELARKLWWVLSDAAIARYMLRNKNVVQGEMGQVLAEFLLEFLPFMEKPIELIESVELVLQPGLLSREQQTQLWLRAVRKTHVYVGFLHALPDQLLEQAAAHPDYQELSTQLADLVQQGNPFARQLLRLYSASGQTFIKTCQTVLIKPLDQDVVVSILEAIDHYFAATRLSTTDCHNHDQIAACISDLKLQSNPAYQAAKTQLKGHHTQLAAVLHCSLVGEALVRSIFSTTGAIGTVMRKRAAPVVEPLIERLQLFLAN